MKKIILLLICVAGLTAYAQEPGLDCKKTIISIIDNDENYLYADKTAKEENEAMADAQQTLRQLLSNYLFSHQLDASTGQIDKIMSNNLNTCVVPRADKMRVFLYVRLSDVKSAATAVADNQPSQQEAMEEVEFVSWDEVADWLTDDEEEAVAPKAAEEAVVEITEADAPEEVYEESDPEPKTVREEPAPKAKAEPVVEVSEADAPIKTYTEKQSEPKTVREEPASKPAVASGSQFEGYDVVLGMKRKNEIFNYIKENNNGTYKPNVKASDMGYFLILYHRDGTIEAILSPRDARTGERINLLTGQPDKITSHKGCAIDGFILSR